MWDPARARERCVPLPGTVMGLCGSAAGWRPDPAPLPLALAEAATWSGAGQGVLAQNSACPTQPARRGPRTLCRGTRVLPREKAGLTHPVRWPLQGLLLQMWGWGTEGGQ